MNPGRIDLNADVGEGADGDGDLIALVSTVNIACGGHAGDASTMRRTLALAARHGAAIGAHPGYEDPEHFGRRELSARPGESGALVVRQVLALQTIASELGLRVGHVKLHGALYNLAARDRWVAREIIGALAAVSKEQGTLWTWVALAGSAFVAEARALGGRVLEEAFADRRYRSDGSLTPRSQPGSTLAPDAAVCQAVRIATEGTVVADDGQPLGLRADTLCIHGDGPDAVALARRVRSGLAGAGILVAAAL